MTFAGLVGAGVDGGEGFLLAVEAEGGAFELLFLHAGDFDDGAVWGEVAAEADDAAGGGDGAGDGVDDVLVLGEDGAGEVFGEGLAGDGDAVAVEEAAVEEGLEDDGDAADAVDVEGDVFSAGLEVGDVGGAAHDGEDVVHGEADAGFVGEGGEVEAGIGAAAGGGDDDGGVFEGFEGDDVAGAEAGFEEGHDGAPAFGGPAVAVLVGRG